MAELDTRDATDRLNPGTGPAGPEIVQLLLLFARHELSPDQKERATALCRGIEDWDSLERIALEHQGLPLAYRHLSRLEQGVVPAGVLLRMHRLALLLAAQSLRVEAALRNFQQVCLAPVRARHAFLKGFPLGARYYEAPALRPCRDIDVLVDARRLAAVVLQARKAGYRIYDAPPSLGDWDVAAHCRFATDVALVSPDGVLIEVHKTLDQGLGLFDTGRLLRRAEDVSYAGQPMRVLRTSDLFVYVCAHHTRHFWSHLHWFADLDAMGRDPSFDLHEVMHVARATGLGATVEACLELRDRVAGIGSDAMKSAGASRAGEVLEYAIDCLVRGREREVQLRDTVRMGNFAFDWQVTRRQQWRHWLRDHTSLLRPWPADYRAWPLPPHLHGVYYVTRPVRLLWRVVTGRR